MTEHVEGNTALPEKDDAVAKARLHVIAKRRELHAAERVLCRARFEADLVKFGLTEEEIYTDGEFVGVLRFRNGAGCPMALYGITSTKVPTSVLRPVLKPSALSPSTKEALERGNRVTVPY